MNSRILPLTVVALLVLATIGFFNIKKPTDLPLVVIANWGPHASLEAAIQGLKQELAQQDFIEHKTIRYEIADVGFNPALIPQMIAKLKSDHPHVMVVMATPVAQFAKGQVSDIPLVYSAITDPVAAGLIQKPDKPDKNMTGSAEMQDLNVLLQFARKLMPQAKTVGLVYATSESNDAALVTMMRQAAAQQHMAVLALPVDQARDVPLRMQEFKGKVDFVYVGTSGPIQPTLPVIAAMCKKMGIPVLNAEGDAVKKGLALASFGVDYAAVGKNAGRLVARILKGAAVNTLTPLYPTLADHKGFVSRKKAAELHVTLPQDLHHVDLVE